MKTSDVRARNGTPRSMPRMIDLQFFRIHSPYMYVHHVLLEPGEDSVGGGTEIANASLRATRDGVFEAFPASGWGFSLSGG